MSGLDDTPGSAMSGATLPERLTQDDLAVHWRMSPRTLERWRRKRIGPVWMRFAGRVLYRREDVLAHEASLLRRDLD